MLTIRLEREFEAETQPANGKAPAMTMWVDKYRPKKFSDLLGEDVSAKKRVPDA